MRVDLKIICIITDSWIVLWYDSGQFINTVFEIYMSTPHKIVFESINFSNICVGTAGWFCWFSNPCQQIREKD